MNVLEMVLQTSVLNSIYVEILHPLVTFNDRRARDASCRHVDYVRPRQCTSRNIDGMCNRIKMFSK